MPSNPNTTDIEPRDPEAYPHHPKRDARAVRPVYVFEDVEEVALYGGGASAGDLAAAEDSGRAVQVQTPREPEAYPAFPQRN